MRWGSAIATNTNIEEVGELYSSLVICCLLHVIVDIQFESYNTIEFMYKCPCTCNNAAQTDKHTFNRNASKNRSEFIDVCFVYMIFMLIAQLLTNDDDYSIRELFTNLIFAYSIDEERTSKQRHNWWQTTERNVLKMTVFMRYTYEIYKNVSRYEQFWLVH